MELAKYITNPAFWLGTVIGGILLHVISHYVIRAFDRWMSGTSSRWRSRSEARIKKNQLAEQQLSQSAELRAIAWRFEVRFWFMTVLMMGGAVCMGALASTWAKKITMLSATGPVPLGYIVALITTGIGMLVCFGFLLGALFFAMKVMRRLHAAEKLIGLRLLS